MLVDSVTLLPRDKYDIARARELIALGYPAVEPVLPQLMVWIQDMNWPVAKVVAPFLASVGRPLLPHVRHVLSGDDDIWKYWCLWEIIGQLPLEVVRDLELGLVRLARSPTRSEVIEEVDEAARHILATLGSPP